MMRTKNFIKTVKELISSFFNLPQDSTIEDLTQPDGPLVPIVHWQMERCRMTFDENLPIPNIEVTVEGLPPIPEDCQVPTTTMPCSRYYANDLHPVDYDRLLGDQGDPMTPIGFERWKASCQLAKEKMHNCRYFANSPYLKCTANPTNTNCLECNKYEHHNSNKMES